ncbi:MAG: hypothetical protein KGJ57_02920 [Sphingomonadales bacterium]|nr:hypothetical protein [Sphingomonadales bacterium]MDE2168363.1 hypothetical protein [Sphingomonadales bacterium]
MPAPAPRPFRAPTARRPVLARRMARLGCAGVMMAGAITAGAGSATAQSIGDWNGSYKTPPGSAAKPSPSPAPRIDVDPVIPVTPASHSAPHKAQPAKTRHPAQPRHATHAEAPPAQTAKPAAPTPSPTPTPKPTPTPTPTPPATTPATAVNIPAPAPAPKAAIAPSPAPAQAPLPQWPLAVAALLGALGGWALWRRKPASTAGTASDGAPPMQAVPVQGTATTPEPAPAPAMPPAVEPAPVAPPTFAAAIARVELAAPGPELTLDFRPTRFATTLTEATLRYRLILSNHGRHELGPLVITGAMEAAQEPTEEEPAPLPAPQEPATPEPALHVFRPAPGFSPHPHFIPDTLIVQGDENAREPDAATETPEPPPVEPDLPASQAPQAEEAAPPANWPICHHVSALEPGQSIDLTGQLRMPLAEIEPIRLGGAAMVVPLVRLRAAIDTGGDDGADQSAPLAALCMIIGERMGAAPATSGRQGDTTPLAPLRLQGKGTDAEALATRILPS